MIGYLNVFHIDNPQIKGVQFFYNFVLSKLNFLFFIVPLAEAWTSIVVLIPHLNGLLHYVAVEKTLQHVRRISIIYVCVCVCVS